MKPEQLVEQVKSILGANLRSIVLYGSGATGDFVENQSDYNLLMLTQQLGFFELKSLAEPIRAWVKDGNPPPFLFTERSFRNSADVFPLEVIEMQERHRLLFGEDLISNIKPSLANLRHQLEYEFKSKLNQLRSHYLASNGRPKELVNLMVDSLASFLALGRGALRLLGEPVPAEKLEAVRRLSQRLDFSPEPLEIIAAIKAGRPQQSESGAEQLFQRYLSTLETISEGIDQQLHSGGK